MRKGKFSFFLQASFPLGPGGDYEGGGNTEREGEYLLIWPSYFLDKEEGGKAVGSFF